MKQIIIVIVGLLIIIIGWNLTPLALSYFMLACGGLIFGLGLAGVVKEK